MGYHRYLNLQVFRWTEEMILSMCANFYTIPLNKVLSKADQFGREGVDFISDIWILYWNKRCMNWNGSLRKRGEASSSGTWPQDSKRCRNMNESRDEFIWPSSPVYGQNQHSVSFVVSWSLFIQTCNLRCQSVPLLVSICDRILISCSLQSSSTHGVDVTCSPEVLRTVMIHF